MRHTHEAIYQWLEQQATSGQSVAAFCADHGLKVPTFYSWKRKHNSTEPTSASGFCELLPARTVSARKLCLPSGLELEIMGLSTREIAQLMVEIDRAYV